MGLDYDVGFHTKRRGALIIGALNGIGVGPPAAAGLGEPSLLAQVQTLPAAPRIAPKAVKTVELKLGGFPVQAVPRRPPSSTSTME